jgi:hypothetical protein
MPIFKRGAATVLLLICATAAQQPTKPAAPAQQKSDQPASDKNVQQLLEANVRAEWDAFKNRDKKAYSELLAPDFVGVEDDGEGTRNRYAAANEIDRSVINNYFLAFLRVMPLDANSAFLTYEITMEFPPRAQVRYKRIFICELWLRRDGEWKMRHYQETRVR